jgi:D-alanyl-D-alanine carboxypeptidase
MTMDLFLTNVLEVAGREARTDRSPSIEAHHLLLAISMSGDPVTRRLLDDAGLDVDNLRNALNREFDQSLGAAGISRPGDLESSDDPFKSPSLGSSAKLAIERGLGSASQRHGPAPADLLLGILQASVGTLPRALALSGIDREALAARVRQARDESGEIRTRRKGLK